MHYPGRLLFSFLFRLHGHVVTSHLIFYFRSCFFFCVCVCVNALHPGDLKIESQWGVGCIGCGFGSTQNQIAFRLGFFLFFLCWGGGFLVRGFNVVHPSAWSDRCAVRLACCPRSTSSRAHLTQQFVHPLFLSYACGWMWSTMCTPL